VSSHLYKPFCHSAAIGAYIDFCYPPNESDIVNRTDRRLLRELVVVIVLKLVILIALWFAFVRDQRVSVDADSVAAAVTSPAFSVRGSQGEVHGQ